ncbi:MAG: alpha-L-arabinofuranosidase C-terminal domain-containing protein, partial [Oscillospiraceae bacterium]
KMVLTPTYHVFRMYNGHHGATLLESSCDNVTAGSDGAEIPAITHSASMDENGNVLITIANCSLENEYELDISLGGFKPSNLSAEILTGDVHAHNTFDAPEAVKPTAFDNIQLEVGNVRLTIPPCSVFAITLTK